MSLSDDLKKCANIASSLEQQLSTLTADHDKLTQDHQALAERLRESEAGAAALRKELEYFAGWGRCLNELIGHRATPESWDRIDAALAGTAGRGLLAEMEATKKRMEGYKAAYDHAVECVDRAFQTDSTKPEPILPDFVEIGGDKFLAVVRLAECYRSTLDEVECLRQWRDEILTELQTDYENAVRRISKYRARIAELEAKLKAAEPPPAAPDIERLAEAAWNAWIGPSVSFNQASEEVKDGWRAVARAVLDAAGQPPQPPQPSAPVGVEELMRAVEDYAAQCTRSLFSTSRELLALREESLATVRRLAEQLAGLGASNEGTSP